MEFVFYFLGLVIVATWGVLCFIKPRPSEITQSDNARMIEHIDSLKSHHEIALRLHELVEKDGAGDWPPRANHDLWPAALRPYNDIYLRLAPLLPAKEPSLDNGVNHERRGGYRSLMRKLLSEQIDIVEVEKILVGAEAGNWDTLPRDAYNGFYCCIAVCRHAYRQVTRETARPVFN